MQRAVAAYRTESGLVLAAGDAVRGQRHHHFRFAGPAQPNADRLRKLGDPGWQPPAVQIGQTGGVENVTLLQTNIPAHTHAMNASTREGLNNTL